MNPRQPRRETLRLCGWVFAPIVAVCGLAVAQTQSASSASSSTTPGTTVAQLRQAPTRPPAGSLQQRIQAIRQESAGMRRGFGPLELPQMPQDPNDAPLPLREPLLREGGVPYDFYFSRIAYSGLSKWGYASWSVDFPKADRQFLLGVQRLVDTLDLYPFENAMLLDSDALLDFPFLYAVEVGNMLLTPAEKEGLRKYLLAGGFLMVDDFWGSQEWDQFAREITEVLPGYTIETLPMDHPIFHTFYDIDRVVQVPNLGLARDIRNGISNKTWESDGFVAEVKGIFDENRRLMVAINWNCDLGDAWEWAESSEYPLEFSTYAYQIGVNTIVYAMTH